MLCCRLILVSVCLLTAACAQPLPVIEIQPRQPTPVRFGEAPRPALAARLADQGANIDVANRLAVGESWVKRHIYTEKLSVGHATAYADFSTSVPATPYKNADRKLPPAPTRTLSPDQFNPDHLR